MDDSRIIHPLPANICADCRTVFAEPLPVCRGVGCRKYVCPWCRWDGVCADCRCVKED